MNDHLTPLRAAYVAQMQRTFRQSTRGIPTPEQRRAWSDDADALVAAHDRETAARAWDEGERHESHTLATFGQFCPHGTRCNPYREGDPT